ncbi:MAG: hypothetical protein AAGH40_06840 [Verrucomicrobiota bacterium]
MFNVSSVNFEELKLDLQIICKERELSEEDSLAALIKRLDAYAQRPDLPGRLEHYLSRRSYQKALAWINDPELPHQV